MEYLLTVLTNNRPVYLERTMAAFARYVRPAPTRVIVLDDGGRTPDLRAPMGYLPVEARELRTPGFGQCRAMQMLWDAAAASDLDWWFHIEDDQVILRPVDLEHLAYVVEKVGLAQMALMRTPWGAEIEHGGYIPKDPGFYTRRGREFSTHQWIETTRNWAFAPALIPQGVVAARFARYLPDRDCETSIGPSILDAYPEMRFGLWGWGEPWCAHIGVDRGAGAHGY
jgi:hypothetical protein